MNALPLTPAPYSDESPYGYMLRLSEANGHDGVRPLIGQVESAPNYVITVGWDFQKLAPLLGPLQTLPSGFGYRAPGYIRGRASLHGKPVSARHLGLIRARVCPHCLRGRGYVPAYWDLKAYVACHVHGCMMLKMCSCCGKRIKYFRGGVGKCSCGHILLDEEVQAAPEELVALSEILSVLVTGQGDLLVAHKLGWPIRELLKCELESFCRILVTFANVIINMSKGKRRPNRLAEVSANLENVGTIFTAWPLGFRRFAAEWHGYSLGRKQIPNVFQSCYSWAFITLHKNLKKAKTQTNFLLAALLEYGYQHWSRRAIKVKERELKGIGGKRRFGNYMDAAEALGMPAYTVVRWLKNGRLPATAVGKKRNRPSWVVDLYALEKIRLSKFQGLDIRSAPKHIGVSNTVYRELLKAGDIPSEYLTDWESTASVEDLDSFVKGVLRYAISIRSTSGLHSLSDFMCINANAESKAQLLRDIRDQKVIAYLSGDKKISNLYLREDPFLSSRAKQFGIEEEVLTIHRACLKHNLFFHEARAIFRHIEGDKEFTPMYPLLAIKVDGFLKENIPLRKAASLIGVESRDLIRGATKMSLEVPIFSLPAGRVGSKSESNSQAWFMRASTTGKAKTIATRIFRALDK